MPDEAGLAAPVLPRFLAGERRQPATDIPGGGPLPAAESAEEVAEEVDRIAAANEEQTDRMNDIRDLIERLE